MALNSTQRTLSGIEIPVIGYGVSVEMFVEYGFFSFYYSYSNHYPSCVHSSSLTYILGLRNVRYGP